MNIEIKEISQCVREMKLVITADEALKDYNSILNSFKKYASIPGFRKGKAPSAMIERNYGPSVKEEYFNQKLDGYYKSALKEKNLKPVNQAEAISVDWDKGKDFIAVFKFETMPEIKIENYKNLEIPYEKTLFKKEMINATLEDFRYKMGSEEVIEGPVEKNDNLKLTITIPSGTENKTISRELIQGKNQYSQSFNKKLVGLNSGEIIKSKLFTNSQEIDDKDIDANLRDQEFEIKVEEIRRIKLPELDDDFAKDIEFESMEKLKDKIQSDIEIKIDRENKDRLKTAIISKIIEVNPFDIPASIIRQYAENMAKSSAETYKMDIDKLVPIYLQIAEYNLKTHYVIEDLIKKEEIKISETEKEELIKEAAQNMDIDLAKYKKLYKKQIESDDFDFAASEKKLIEFLEKNSKFVPYPDKKEQEKQDLESKKQEKTD